jgi:hypothetical protein
MLAPPSQVLQLVLLLSLSLSLSGSPASSTTSVPDINGALLDTNTHMYVTAMQEVR